jgi:Flp pilus assembly protein TadB
MSLAAAVVVQSSNIKNGPLIEEEGFKPKQSEPMAETSKKLSADSAPIKVTSKQSEPVAETSKKSAAEKQSEPVDDAQTSSKEESKPNWLLISGIAAAVLLILLLLMSS